MEELNTDEIMATVARLEELLVKATPGPWFAESEPHREPELCGAVVRAVEGERGTELFDTFNRGYKRSLIDREEDDEDRAGEFYDKAGIADLELVAEARNALPALLAAIRTLTANLREHGEHMLSCPSHGHAPQHEDCDCGLARALKGFGVGC